MNPISKVSVLLFLFTLGQVANGQNFLSLKSGERIEYKSLDIDKDVINVKLPDKTVKTIRVGDVFGRCGERLFLNFNKPKFIDLKFRTHVVNVYSAYLYVQEEGRIDVIGGESGTVSGVGGAGFSVGLSGDFIAIKDGEVFEVSLKKKERRETLLKLLGDKDEFKAILTDSTQDIERDDVLKMIRKYNVATFSPAEKYINPVPAIFYSNNAVKGEKVEIFINDTPQAQLSTKWSTHQVDLIGLKKICVKKGALENCRLIRATECDFVYFEIVVKEKRNQIELIEREKNDFIRFQQSLKSKS